MLNRKFRLTYVQLWGGEKTNEQQTIMKEKQFEDKTVKLERDSHWNRRAHQPQTSKKKKNNQSKQITVKWQPVKKKVFPHSWEY